MDPALTSHSSATAFPGDLMNPNLAPGTRIPISLYPAASLPARAIDHGIIMKYVDSSTAGPPAGTADFPYKTLAQAVAVGPPGAPLLMIPGTYDEVTPMTVDTPHVIDVARGGSAVVK